MDVCHKNLTMMARKFAKVMRIFGEIKHIIPGGSHFGPKGPDDYSHPMEQSQPWSQIPQCLQHALVGIVLLPTCGSIWVGELMFVGYGRHTLRVGGTGWAVGQWAVTLWYTVGLNILHHLFLWFCDWYPSKNGDMIIELQHDHNQCNQWKNYNSYNKLWRL